MKRECSVIGATMVALLVMGGGAQAGQCSTQIGELQKLLTGSDAGMGPTENAATKPETPGVDSMSEPGTPPTTGTSKALEGKAASPQDVQRQNEDLPTAGDVPATGQMPTANTRQAQESLARAQEFDKAGKEAECQNEVNKAKAAFRTP